MTTGTAPAPITTRSEPLLTASGPRSRTEGVLRFSFLLGAHAVLGLVMLGSSTVATVHAIAVLVGSLAMVLVTSRPVWWAALSASYIVGAEVLWRMTGAAVFWESGKYAVTVLLLIALYRLPNRKVDTRALAYLTLLAPGAIVTLTTLDLADARGRLSFNLSGPLALAVCTVFFVNIRMTVEQIKQMFLSLITPVFAVAVVGVYSTLTAVDLKFTGESNAVTSGGYGPNQVSSMLGLGVLIALLWMLLTRGGATLRLALLAVAGLFTAQSAMTFSRGGLYAATGALVCSAFYLMRNSLVRNRALATLPLFVLGLVAVVVPRLDSFTGGALGSRFADTNVSHRDELVRSDVRLLIEHPVFGSGPGVVRVERGSLAHTEFTRLLSEHGAFGLLALLLLLWITWKTIRRSTDNLQRGISVALFAWSFLYMASNGMRLAAPSFIYGFGMATLVPSLTWVLVSPGGRKA